VGGGEKYLAVAAEAIRDSFRDVRVEIVSPAPADRELYERMLAVDLSGIHLRSTTARVTALHRRLNSIRRLRLYRDLFVSARAVRFTRDYDLLLSMVYVIPAFTRARRSVILCQFPYTIGSTPPGVPSVMRPLYRIYTLPERLLRPILVGDDLRSFQKVICYSEYVRGWVRRYWHRDSDLVFPPIDIPVAEPDFDLKDRVILSVGRFFSGGHSKRHDVLIQAFRQMCDAGLGGWELHLAGSVHRDEDSLRYFERVQDLAHGYPVHIHEEPAYEDLQHLYRRASIYWHASGFGIDPDRDPIALEHFGMTTAEAMSHGVVPVVLAAGGQLEVVHDGEDGFHWRTLDELQERTRRLIDDPGLIRRLALAARSSSRRYSRPEFKRRMADSLRPLIDDLRQG